MKATTDHVQKIPPVGKISYEEFLAWAHDDVRAEWVNGEVFVVSPASKKHQALVVFLNCILQLFIKKHNLGQLFVAPFQMHLGSAPSGREPDLLFVRLKNLRRLKENYLDGPADVAIEITSPDSIGRDRGEKFVEYEKGKVSEYWLIDPDRCQADFYCLGRDGRFHEVLTDKRGAFHSKAIKGFWLRPEWLWQDPLPSELDVAKDLKLI